MWLRPAWREGGWWDSVCVSMSVRNSPQREAHPGYILAVGMTTTLYWEHWGMGFPRDPGVAVRGCCCPWQCLVPPGSIFPTTQRGHGLVSCSGIQEPIRDTTACGRKALAVPVPARAALRVRNVPAPLGCTFPVLFSSNSLSPNPKREQPEPWGELWTHIRQQNSCWEQRPMRAMPGGQERWEQNPPRRSQSWADARTGGSPAGHGERRRLSAEMPSTAPAPCAARVSPAPARPLPRVPLSPA